MKMRSSWKICIAALVGFVLGALLFRTPSSAQAQGRASVTVQQLLSPQGVTHIPVDGSQIVGFSCVPEDGRTDCYVASAK